MKRLSNIYNEIISIENLLLAHKNACKGKSKQYGVVRFKKNLHANIQALHEELRKCRYVSPTYKSFTIYEPKEREIFVIPYRDRIVQHAILQKISGMFVKTFVKHTYSCIKNRGLHKAGTLIKKAVRLEGNDYCLKFDIEKYYPSIDHDILKSLLRRKIKDKQLLNLLDIIIDGQDKGVVIGSYISQWLGNFYLSYFDHWMKEEKKVKYTWRYCDDICVVGSDKNELHKLLADCKDYLWDNLKLKVKGNHQVFPIDKRGIDFLGYVFFKTHTRLRKSIKQKFARKLAKGASKQTIASYSGWLKWCDSINLKSKLLDGYETN